MIGIIELKGKDKSVREIEKDYEKYIINQENMTS